MEADAAMEDEAEAAAPSPSSKRLALKNSIQTNFGDDYVFQIAANEEISNLAVSLSTNTIKLYSPVTGQYFGECRGHSGTIHEIYFPEPLSPQAICSCSSDGTIRTWDIRTFNQVSLLRANSSQEIYSFCYGGSSGNLLVGGCKAQIYFWDWRNGKQVACLEESHMEDVTQSLASAHGYAYYHWFVKTGTPTSIVHLAWLCLVTLAEWPLLHAYWVQFVPNQQNKLISASIDGLLCLFDTSGHIDDDDHLESVMNVETSIAKIGFFGRMNQKFWCLTHIETLSIWDLKDTRRDVNFEDARSLASEKWNLDHIDYFVDCHYSDIDDRLWVIGGTASGTLGYFPISPDHAGTIDFAEAILEGGHAGVVRSVLPASNTHCTIAKKGIFGWTGGEDGRLCCWLSDESLEAKRSWISNPLVMRSHKARSKQHHPY